MKKLATISDSLVTNQELLSRRDNLKMDYYLKTYLDRNIIDEYAIDFELDVNDISAHDQNTLLNIMMENDPLTKEAILDRMHELIQARLEILKYEYKTDNGYKPVIDNQTGEITYQYRGI